MTTKVVIFDDDVDIDYRIYTVDTVASIFEEEKELCAIIVDAYPRMRKIIWLKKHIRAWMEENNIRYKFFLTEKANMQKGWIELSEEDAILFKMMWM